MTIEITDWLRKLGLEQYAPAFRDNAIDSKVLPRLTAEDLKDAGVEAPILVGGAALSENYTRNNCVVPDDTIHLPCRLILGAAKN